MADDKEQNATDKDIRAVIRPEQQRVQPSITDLDPVDVLCNSSMSRGRKPPRRATEIGDVVRDSVDFKGKHVDKTKLAEKLRKAWRWLRLPLEDFLREMRITPADEVYDEIVAIWREFHD